MSKRTVGAYSVDETSYPVVSIAPSPTNHDPAQLDESYRYLQQLLTRGEALAVLFDLRGGVSSPSRRRRLAEFTEQNELALKRHVVAVAVVVGNALERGVVTAAAWLRPPPVPVRVFTALSEAEHWLRSELPPP